MVANADLLGVRWRINEPPELILVDLDGLRRVHKISMRQRLQGLHPAAFQRGIDGLEKLRGLLPGLLRCFGVSRRGKQAERQDGKGEFERHDPLPDKAGS